MSRGSAHRRRGSPLSAVLGLLAALVAGTASARAAEPSAWVPPTGARVMAFAADAPPSGSPTDVDPVAPIRLTPGNVLLVPIDPGERVRIEGHVAAIGFGSGVREAPDVITWVPLPKPSAESGEAEARVVDVPMWAVARFLVIRTDKPTDVAVRTASLTRTAMPWHRLDEDVVRWLRNPSAPTPTTDIPEAAASLRFVLSAASALAAAPRDAVADFLTVRWLEASLAARPLVEPFFVRRPVLLSGGRDASGIGGLVPEPDTSPIRVVLASRGARAANMARIVVDAESADVARVLVRARGLGVARARVYVGDFLVRELVWDVALRTTDRDRWTATQSLRVPLPVGARRVVVEAIQGEIAVAASAFRKRTDVLDVLPKHRDRSRRLETLEALPAEPAETNLLRLAAAADRSATSSDAGAAVNAAEKEAVPSAMRALLLAESVRWAHSPDQALRTAERAFDLAAALPYGTSGPVLRAVLERLAAVYADPLPPPRPWERPLPETAHEDDRAAMDALRGILSPPEDGRRPELAPRAERFAWLHGDDDGAASRARQTWVREAPWDTLDPPPGVAVWNEIGVPVDAYGDPRCRVVGSRGLRWTVLSEGRTEIDVLPPPVSASHSRILFLPGQTEPLPEGELFIDGVAATTHTGAGLATTIAVAPGAHAFERPKGAAPIYARIPRDGAAPCESLRELTRWVRLAGTARFRIPDAGRATVARVVVYAAGAAPRKPRILRVAIGDRVFEAWVRDGASGAIELPVPADVSDVEVETSEETLLRVSARMHAGPTPPPRIASAGIAASPEARSLLLARVRDATRELDGGNAATREASRKKRAVALESLGFPALAALDRGEDPSLDALEDAGPPAQALALPQGSPSVVPLGLLPKIPPLPLPANLEPLTAARRAESTGDASTALAALAKGNAGASTDADGLLFAVLAERTGAGFLAADVFERIGLLHRSGPALARAAALSVDRAADDRDRARALRSFVLAQLAADFGDPASSAFARLAPAVGWLSVTRADSTAGTGLVDVRGGREPRPLGVDVRRALLDAHEDALLLAEGQHIELRLKQSKPTSIGIKTRCLALEADPICKLGVELDGVPTPCGPDDPASSTATCTISVPRGSHRVEIRGPLGRDTIGTAELSSDGGFAVEARVVSEWFELDPERPLELAFAAPTVVRVTARGPSGEPRTLPWSVTGAKTSFPNVETKGELVLDPAPDPSAHLVGGDPKTLLPLGRALEKRIAVLSEGPHALRIGSPQGRSVVRIELAVPIGLPKPRRVPAIRRLPDAPSLAPEAPVKPAPDVVFDRDPGPGTLSVYGRYQNLDVDDEDKLTGKSFAELGLRLRREIETIGGFASVAGFVRARLGAPSFGAAGWLDIPSNGWIPGVFLRGRVVAQPKVTVGLGLRGLVGPIWSIPVADSFSVVPWAALGLVYTDEALAGQEDADREIWTLYSSKRPLYGSFGLRSVFRLAIDGLASVGVSARTTPDFAFVDRADLEGQLQLLPGRGLMPWIVLGAFTSYRPAYGELRREAFWRTGIEGRLTFWTWLARGHRLSAGGEARLLLDIPRENSPFRLSGGIFVEYDFSGGRGLRDLPPRDAPFRARLEEDSGRIDRRKPSSDPTWVTPP